MKTEVHFRSYRAQILEWKMFQKKSFREKFKTHIACSTTFFFLKNCSIYQKTYKYVLEPYMPQVAI